MMSVCGLYCCFVRWCFVVFFFKQKTAYDMRISDWSSDVCSSDLALDRRVDRGALAARALVLARRLDAREPGLPAEQRLGIALRARAFERVGDIAIGRASCRERMW